MITIKDIARECNVSIATVSNVLNGRNKVSDATKKRVLETIELYGYKPNQVAKGLRSKRSNVIAIIAEDLSHFTQPNIVEGIMRYAEDFGYKTLLMNLRLYSRWSDTWFNNEEIIDEVLRPILNEISSVQADGLIYIGVHARDTRKIPENYEIPTVMTYAHELNPSVQSVMIDDERSAYDLVRYLTDKGHRKIGIVAGREDNMHTMLRLEGVKRALREADIEFDPDNVEYASWTRQEGYRVAGRLLKKDITAIFAMADRMAGGIYDRAREYGLTVGKDISIVGYDDQDMSEYLVPSLTTMALPLHKIGITAARLLFNKMEGREAEAKDKDNVVKLPCDFKERASVADIR